MRIDLALPKTKYAEALKRSKDPEFLAKKAAAIQRLKEWFSDPRINHTLPPAVWVGFGKDSMAVLLLLKLAGLSRFTALILDTRADFPGHETVVDEFGKFYGDYNHTVYVAKKRYVDYISNYLDWGKLYLPEEKIDFFNWGSMSGSIVHEVIGRFQYLYAENHPRTLHMWGTRGAEALDRHADIKKNGMLRLWDEGSEADEVWRGQPIGDWRDIDVWALLASENCPVSPVYSNHEIPFKGGKHKFPRTVWYCVPEIFSPNFYRWMAHYYPAVLKEMTDRFPEIKARYQKG